MIVLQRPILQTHRAAASADRLLGFALVLTGLVTLAYWVNYFTGGDVAVVRARWYLAYESSFPAADCWLAACSLLAGAALLRGWACAGAAMLLAGSALIYLAALDITFDIENDLYPLAARANAMRFEIVINAWSLTFGVLAIVAGWRRTQVSAGRDR